MKEKIALIIADDHILFIDGLKMLLKDEPDFNIVDTANDGKELLEVLEERKADIILLDINMPKMNGLEALKFIKKNQSSAKVIFLSTYNEEHLIEKAKSLGANGFLIKNSTKEQLLQCIKSVYNNQSCFPYRLPKDVNVFEDDNKFLKQFNLTKREKEIIDLIKEGCSNQQISDQLFLSIYTIETHRKNILHKLNLKNPAALMKFILENNL